MFGINFHFFFFLLYILGGLFLLMGFGGSDLLSRFFLDAFVNIMFSHFHGGGPRNRVAKVANL